MKYTIIYDYNNEGQFELEMDEDFIPRVGDLICFTHQDGSSKQSTVQKTQINIRKNSKIGDLLIVLEDINE